MAQVMTAWQRVRSEVHRSPGAPSHQVVQAGRLLGRPLGAELNDFYTATDGVQIDAGGLDLFPLIGTEDTLGAVEAAATFRSWGWQVPQELLVIGQDEIDWVYGVWAPPASRRTLVVVLQDTLDEPALAVVATSLPAFLAAWTAFHLPARHGENAGIAACLDMLEVPAGLREPESEFDEEHWHALLAWTSPDLPDEEPDPSRRPTAPEELTRLACA